MQNPYYVQPGGDIGTGLTGLAGALTQAVGQRKDEDKATEKVERFAEMKRGALEAFRSGDSMKMAEFSLANPEMAQAMKNAQGWGAEVDAKQEQEYTDALWSAHNDPSEQNITTLIQEKIESGLPGAETFLDRYMKDPEGAQAQIRQELAWKDPERFKAMREALAPAVADVAERFKVVGGRLVDISGETPRVVIDAPSESGKLTTIQQNLIGAGLEPGTPEFSSKLLEMMEKGGRSITINTGTTAGKNLEILKSLKEGSLKDAFASMVGAKTGPTPKEQAAQTEKQEQISMEITNADDTSALVDKILNTGGYVDSLTGVRGAVPITIPGTAGWDAGVAFDQLQDSLTIDNLSKMSGVLSDADIKILRSAGAGIKRGMSPGAFTKRLDEIKRVLRVKTARHRGKVTGGPETPKSVSEMTDAELMEGL